jgi:uncharacterized membrane protein
LDGIIATDGGFPEPAPRGQGSSAVLDKQARPESVPSAPRADWVPWLIALILFGAYATISLSRYLRLDPGSWDLGIFTEYVRQIAHLHAPVVNIRGPGFNLLGDHFQPIVGLIAPVFLVLPSPATLLAAQALLTAISVVPVSRAAEVRLGTGAGRLIGAAYGLSWGLAQMIYFDFHEVAFAVPLLAFSLSALVTGRIRAAAWWAVPLVFVKEDQGFTVAAIGFLIVLLSARRPPDEAGTGSLRTGLLLAAWGLAWSALAITVIIPHFNPVHQYPYWSDGGVLSPVGQHPTAGAVLGQFGAAWGAKLRTTLLILLPVAFLALRSPVALVALPGLLLRFVSTNSAYWGSGYHYNATVMPIVFIAAIDGLARIRASGHQPWRTVATSWVAPAALAVIALVIVPQFPLRGLWSAQTYQISRHVRAADAAMARVPSGAVVEATLSLVAPLAARDDTYWIGNTGNPAPRYIVFDDADSGWNPEPSNVLAFVEQRHPGVGYRQIFEDNDVYVFRAVGR